MNKPYLLPPLAAIALALSIALPARALEPLPPESMDPPHSFKVEVLQVTDIAPYQESLTGFLQTLQTNGIELGKNLTVNRVKVDFDVENGGFWQKLGVLMRIRQEAARIVLAKPDLVLTIGTPATRYARSILEEAHIPVVFTAVARPEDAGCTSLADGGPGVTGATLYTDMGDSVRLVKQVFPAVERIGMIHSDDENGITHVQAATTSARTLGMSVASRMVEKNDSIVPAVKELWGEGRGVQMFAVPLDTYYGLRKYEAATDLADFSAENRIPVITLALVRMPGAVLYVGADFETVGGLSGKQAVKILKRHTKPDVLPILKQATPTVLIDPQRVAALNIALPPAVLEHKSDVKNGFWKID